MMADAPERAKGGFIEGHEGDVFPILCDPGYIISAAEVRRVGFKDLLDRLNRKEDDQ